MDGNRCRVCTCCFISDEMQGCKNAATHEIWLIDGPPESTLSCADHIGALMQDNCCIWEHHPHGLDVSSRMVRSVLEKRWANLPLNNLNVAVLNQAKRRYLNGEFTLVESLCELINQFSMRDDLVTAALV